MSISRKLVDWTEGWLHLDEKATIRRIRKGIDAEYEQIKAAYGADWKKHRNEINAEFDGITDWDRTQLESLESRRLRRMADRVGVLIPKEFWVEMPGPDLTYISWNHRRELQLSIRAQRRQNWKDWATIIAPLVSLLIGALGAGAALVTALHR